MNHYFVLAVIVIDSLCLIAAIGLGIYSTIDYRRGRR